MFSIHSWSMYGFKERRTALKFLSLKSSFTNSDNDLLLTLTDAFTSMGMTFSSVLTKIFQ